MKKIKQSSEKENIRNRHYLNCEAAICQDNPNPTYVNEAIWYPGELVCSKSPYQKFQQKQIDINKWVAKGKFKNIDIPYTAYDLETKLL